jgi:hypothetical protein
MKMEHHNILELDEKPRENPAQETSIKRVYLDTAFQVLECRYC